jgi:hypothetical protein
MEEQTEKAEMLALLQRQHQAQVEALELEDKIQQDLEKKRQLMREKRQRWKSLGGGDANGMIFVVLDACEACDDP